MISKRSGSHGSTQPTNTPINCTATVRSNCRTTNQPTNQQPTHPPTNQPTNQPTNRGEGVGKAKAGAKEETDELNAPQRASKHVPAMQLAVRRLSSYPIHLLRASFRHSARNFRLHIAVGLVNITSKNNNHRVQNSGARRCKYACTYLRARARVRTCASRMCTRYKLSEYPYQRRQGAPKSFNAQNKRRGAARMRVVRQE